MQKFQHKEPPQEDVRIRVEEESTDCPKMHSGPEENSGSSEERLASQDRFRRVLDEHRLGRLASRFQENNITTLDELFRQKDQSNLERILSTCTRVEQRRMEALMSERANEFAAAENNEADHYIRAIRGQPFSVDGGYVNFRQDINRQSKVLLAERTKAEHDPRKGTKKIRPILSKGVKNCVAGGYTETQYVEDLIWESCLTKIALLSLVDAEQMIEARETARNPESKPQVHDYPLEGGSAAKSTACRMRDSELSLRERYRRLECLIRKSNVCESTVRSMRDQISDTYDQAEWLIAREDDFLEDSRISQTRQQRERKVRFLHHETGISDGVGKNTCSDKKAFSGHAKSSPDRLDCIDSKTTYELRASGATGGRNVSTCSKVNVPGSPREKKLIETIGTSQEFSSSTTVADASADHRRTSTEPNFEGPVVEHEDLQSFCYSEPRLASRSQPVATIDRHSSDPRVSSNHIRPDTGCIRHRDDQQARYHQLHTPDRMYRQEYPYCSIDQDSFYDCESCHDIVQCSYCSPNLHYHGFYGRNDLLYSDMRSCVEWDILNLGEVIVDLDQPVVQYETPQGPVISYRTHAFHHNS